MKMQRVYFDNAATTAMDEQVVDAMIPFLREEFGNPSSTHAYGRKTRAAIENARKRVAAHINASPGEIIFTSGGTEADNMAIRCCIEDHGIKHAITSALEHHAVLYPLEDMAAQGKIKLSLVNTDEKGRIDLNHLQELLSSNERSFVSLMHANNELGNLLPIKEVGELCKQYDALFHADTVQTIGHYRVDARDIHIHFMTCAGHKFHGPKGTGFLYLNSDVKIKPLIRGGSQERNMRGGTENVCGIIGLAKALDVAYENLKEHQQYIQGLKDHMISRLKTEIPGVHFNGDAEGESLYTVLNVCLPETEVAEMLLMSLDIEGIAASGGSACSSGSNVGSHVLKAIGSPSHRPSVRFSFSKYNTIQEVDYAVDRLLAILNT